MGAWGRKEDVEQLHLTRTALSKSDHFLGCGLQSVKKKKKVLQFPPRTAENAQIPAFRLKPSLRVEDLGLLSGRWWACRHSPFSGLPQPWVGTRCPAGAELTSDPAAPGLSTSGATRAGTCTIAWNSLTHLQQLHLNTEGHFKLFIKLNFKI